MTMTVDAHLAAIVDAWDRQGAWRHRAACATAVARGEAALADFWPLRGADISEAVAICARCPVRAPCLDFALANAERDGIWGGLSAVSDEVCRRNSERSEA